MPYIGRREIVPEVKERFMVAPKKPSPAARESAAGVIARQLPEWQLFEPEVEPDAVVEDHSMKIDNGPSIASLRKKFGGADSDAGEPDFAPVDASVETVRIAPKQGGPAKTADIKDGRIKIVQG